MPKNGFAIRRGLPYRCESEYQPLSIDNAVRRGVVATSSRNAPGIPVDVGAPKRAVPRVH